MDSPQTEYWLSASDICQYLSISNDTLYRWIKENEFPAQKIGKRWKSLRSNVDTWIANKAKSSGKVSESLNNRPWDVFKYPLLNEKLCQYSHVSLFSGCGGFDLGFRRAGFKTIFANDINEDAAATYEYNLGNICVGDIRSINIPKITNLDVLSAGFPCQPFSNAGLRKGVDDHRGDLYQRSLEVVGLLKPKIVIFENVRGMLSSKHNGKLLIEIIAENLFAIGYDVTFSLLDASKHNVGEKRLRVLIVGVKRNVGLGVFAFPNVVERNDLCLKNIIFDIAQEANNQNEIVPMSPQAAMLEAMIPEGGSWKDIPYDKLPERLKKIADNIKRYHSPKFYRRFHRNDIAGTITAAFTPEKSGIIHPVEHRFFSVREVARIQSFPDWFVFQGRSIKAKYQQIGNAVPPRLAYEIASAIKDVIAGQNLLQDKNYVLFEDFKDKLKPIKVSDSQVVYRNNK